MYGRMAEGNFTLLKEDKMNHTITDKDIPFKNRIFSFDEDIEILKVEIKRPIVLDVDGWNWHDEDAAENGRVFTAKVMQMKVGDIIPGLKMMGWDCPLYLKRIK
jgi:hypothetical protein